MIAFIERKASVNPYQEWRVFPLEAIVQVKTVEGNSSIGQAKDFWWGYKAEEKEVIAKARLLDQPTRKYEW